MYSANQPSASLLRPPLFIAQLPESGAGQRKITRVLIANRGEIACRVISTCRKLNLTSIAIYVEEDLGSRHIEDADMSINLGSIEQSAGNPFLNIDLIVQTAHSVYADAIHPGYGYLSENPDFSDAVTKAGLIFVGPSAEAMSTLGNKRSSKDYLQKHAKSVPLIPGYSGSSQDVAKLEKAADSIGFPVMLKASAGGGGRGMRIVHDRSKLKDELQRAQSEAQRSFGSSDCIVEKFIEAGKHIEIQIIGDSHGKVVSLWERECSVQRRHQKVIEETPSPFLTSKKRQEMSKVAMTIGELLSYEGAGTVEFVVDAKTSNFYFLEVNTRLQVEHPITEEVTGVDAVALQLYVAAGGRLDEIEYLRKVPQYGHAVECRLCAEDPARGFLPEHGKVHLWRPSIREVNSRDVRFETAMQDGSNVSIYFDSMIAKIVVWAPSRPSAVAKMVKVLAETACAGVRTNQLFLQSCLLHPDFNDPSYTTSFIEKNLPRLLENPHNGKSTEMISFLAIIPQLVLSHLNIDAKNGGLDRPFAHVRRSFRNQRYDPTNLDSAVIVPVDISKTYDPIMTVFKTVQGQSLQSYTVTLFPVRVNDITADDAKDPSKNPAALEVTAKFTAMSTQLRNSLGASESYTHNVEVLRCRAEHSKNALRDSWSSAFIEATIGKMDVSASIAIEDTVLGEPRRMLCHFPSLGTCIEYECYSILAFCESLRETTAAAMGASNQVKAPMPCKILQVLKKEGDDVTAGENVMVIESMKMEMSISIPAEGKFNTKYKAGDAVDEGKILCWVD